MKHLIYIPLIVTIFAITTAVQGKRPLYKPGDSIRVERYLRQAKHLPDSADRVLFFARKFIGKPYVAHTLEKGDEERLVINLDQLDCTTYVDIVTALTLTARNGGTSFAEFMHFLQKQRYPQGVINGYASRNHYFSSWITNCEQQGFTHEIQDSDCQGNHFSGRQKLACSYMSQNPDKYAALRAHPEYIPLIQRQEKALNGNIVSYIPNSQLGQSQEELDCIHEGDILAMVTTKEGLDISHLGFAVWQDGRLHLLNASSLYKKVVIDKNPLDVYNRKQKTNIGVRVIRILQ